MEKESANLRKQKLKETDGSWSYNSPEGRNTKGIEYFSPGDMQEMDTDQRINYFYDLS